MLTFLQVLNFIVWFINVYSGFLSSIYLVVASFVFVGFMGGGSYVYCYYKILESKNIKDEYKELTVNIATIFNDFGILLSSLFVLLVDNTIMP